MNASDLPSRRVLLCSLFPLGFGGASFAREPAGLPKGIGARPDYAGPLVFEPGKLGRKPANAPEEATARQILGRAPDGPTPLDIAKYFLAVGNGDYGDELRPYVSGWPERWNPVIVAFFAATGTKPEGDVTAWCAAFANWCIQRTGRGQATGSASSGSFRTFGTPAASPLPGDIVVFRSADPRRAANGNGHVGFFADQDRNRILVTGGNQIEGRARNHLISNKWLPKSSSALVLHSIRTDPRLH